jgi:E3 ubiquitin-protein ligase RNF103
MFAKAILVLLYFLLVFLVAKFLDLSSSWLELGCVVSPLFNPFALSVRRLKTLLDERGISYVGIVDKTELVQLVKESGSFNSEDNCTELVESRENENNEEITHFRSSAHLFEKIEDTKASGWLVQIIPQYRTSLLSLKQWSKLSKKVTLLGIKTGVFDCRLDPRLCSRNGWDAKCLLLSSPVGQHAKGNVNINVYNSRASVERAFSWLNNVLATRVRKLKTHREYLKYLEKDKNNYETTKIVLFGRLSEDPPALLSSLSIKFTGRVQFAYFKITKENADEIQQKIGIHKLSGLLVVTPERTFFYGTRKGEVLKYNAMAIFLTTLHPEVNDIFLLAIILVNQICFLELFLTPGGVLRKLVKFLLFITFANTALILTWLPLIRIFRFNFTQPLLVLGLKMCRFITDSDPGSLVRYHFLTDSGSSLWFALSFCVYGFCMNRLRKKFKLLNNEDEDTPDWFYHDLVYFRRFFHSFRSTRILSTNMRTNEDNLFTRTYEDIVIQRLATPDLWLRPLMPTDFVKDLPVWKNCDCLSPTREKYKKSSTKEFICDPHLCQWKCRPAKILMTKECAICLDNYMKDCIMVSVPCRHVFHQNCLEKWFKSGNQCKNLHCPVCRWPAYKAKAEILDIPETSEMDFPLD